MSRIRLIDDPSARANVRAALARAIEDAPVDDAWMQGALVRHRAILEGRLPPPASGGVELVRILGWLAGTGAAGTVVALAVAATSGGRPVHVESWTPSDPIAIPTVVAPSQPTPRAPASVPERRTDPPPRARPRRTVARADAAAVVEPPATSELAREEARAVASIRRLVEREPARALEAIARADARFGTGFLGDERRALEVLALVGLDRTDEAHRAGRAYLQQHPDGAMARQVRDGLRRIGSATEGSRADPTILGE